VATIGAWMAGLFESPSQANASPAATHGAATNEAHHAAP
jgi:hypothetical protein